jgi:hypothetical protein
MIRPSRYDRDERVPEWIANVVAVVISLAISIPAAFWFCHTFLQGAK